MTARSPNGTRRKPCLVPLTVEEFAELRLAAGDQPLATWIREIALGAARLRNATSGVNGSPD